MVRSAFHRSKVALASLIIVAFCSLLGFAYHRYMYPFGFRSCGLRCVQSALLVYAGEHQGNFPSSDNGPYDALQKLYPEYCPTGKELAGISGDVDRVAKALQGGGQLNEVLTSWIYLPGLRQDDNQQLAILWESKGGLYANGKRNPAGGHAVLLVGGDITNVPATDWTNFLAEQETLRKAAFQKHKVAKL